MGNDRVVASGRFRLCRQVCSILGITLPFPAIHLFDPLHFNFLSDEWIDGETKGIDPGNITDGVEICSFSCSFFICRIDKAHLLIDEGLIEQFYDQLSVVSRMKPYMVGPGNHEGVQLPSPPEVKYFLLSLTLLTNNIPPSTPINQI